MPGKVEFSTSLETILEECHTAKSCPILHIESHGCEDRTGLVLSSGEKVTWIELNEYLSQINYLTGNNLFLTLAVCYGANLMDVLRMDKPAPFWGFIGSHDVLFEEDLMIRYNEFYTELLTTKSSNPLGSRDFTAVKDYLRQILTFPLNMDFYTQVMPLFEVIKGI